MPAKRLTNFQLYGLFVFSDAWESVCTASIPGIMCCLAVQSAITLTAPKMTISRTCLITAAPSLMQVIHVFTDYTQFILLLWEKISINLETWGSTLYAGTLGQCVHIYLLSSVYIYIFKAHLRRESITQRFASCIRFDLTRCHIHDFLKKRKKKHSLRKKLGHVHFVFEYL